MNLWAALIGLIGVIVTAGATYWLGARKSSGRIDTTEAEVLWAEATAMREAYRMELAQVREEAMGLRAEVMSLRVEVIELRGQVHSYQRRERPAGG